MIPALERPAQHRGHDAAVLRSASRTSAIRAARRDDAAVDAEGALVGLIGAVEQIGELELARVQARADLGADVAADALADAADSRAPRVALATCFGLPSM